MSIFFQKTKSGFTAVEILVAVTIVALLSVITFVSFSNLNSREVLDKESLKVLSLIQDARSLTLSSKNSSQYGVYFEENRVISFAGGSYNPSDQNNLVTDLSSRVRIFDIEFAGGGDTLIFDRLSGETDQFGVLKMSLISDPSSIKTIRIFKTGLSEIR